MALKYALQKKAAPTPVLKPHGFSGNAWAIAGSYDKRCRVKQEAAAEIWTIRRVLQWAIEDFEKRGLETPRLEAEILLGEILDLDRVRLLIDGSRPLSNDELNQYKAWILRRRKGEPSSYILGYREFFGQRFNVDARVLIPRPDTEILVEVALARTEHRDLHGRALDLCTGSGAVAISFALKRPTWIVTGTDIENGALEVARQNAEHLGATWKLRFLAGDLFGALPPGERFELITANPPYIPEKEWEGLENNVRDFEPKIALVGGVDGLDFYRRLTKDALSRLVRGGVIAVEVGAGQAHDVASLFEEAGYIEIDKTKDYGGHQRVVSARAPIAKN